MTEEWHPSGNYDPSKTIRGPGIKHKVLLPCPNCGGTGCVPDTGMTASAVKPCPACMGLKVLGFDEIQA